MVTEIAPDVYELELAQLANGRRYRAYLFDFERPTLVDTGRSDTTDALLDELDAVGISPERVVLTHGDGDHVGGFETVVDAHDPETFAPVQCVADVDADRTYGDGDTIGRFEAVHVPGHTVDNHVLIDEDGGVAVMGDAVSGADQRGLPAGRFHLPPEIYSEDLSLAERSLEKLLDYEFEVGLVFHGSSVTEGASDVLRRYVEFPGKPDR